MASEHNMQPAATPSPTGRPTRSEPYRAFVGPAGKYDLVAAMQFNLLTLLGLRETHYLLDIGCGSLRGGRLFIPYLRPGRYHGVEPEAWLIDEGIRNEAGQDLIELKQPRFSHAADFSFDVFGRKFDFVLAQSIFSHASAAQMSRCLSKAAAVMQPAAVFAATFVRGETDYDGEGWVYPECVSYRLETVRSLAGACGLSCRVIDWPHPNSQTWIALTHAGGGAVLPPLTDPVKAARRLAKLEGYAYVKVRTAISAWLRNRKR